MKSLYPILLPLLLVAAAASAHKDRILSIRRDGSIPEIPASFGGVFLKIGGLGTPRPTVQFRSGKNLNVLPPCVTRFIRSRKANDVYVTGSWYHEQSSLPYYINVEFNDPDDRAGRAYRSNFSILFNLRTGSVIKMERFVADASGNGGRYFPVKLPASCKFARDAAWRSGTWT